MIYLAKRVSMSPNNSSKDLNWKRSTGSMETSRVRTPYTTTTCRRCYLEFRQSTRLQATQLYDQILIFRRPWLDSTISEPLVCCQYNKNSSALVEGTPSKSGPPIKAGLETVVHSDPSPRKKSFLPQHPKDGAII